MTYVVIVLVLIVVLLGYMLYSQSQAGKKQTAEQQQLLADYQRRVDEQQKIALGDAEIEVDPALIQYDQQEKNDNDASLIVKIFYKEDEWLLPGDIEKDAIEIWLGENTQTFDIVKMPHHGRKEGNTKEFIENTDPSIAVITDSTEDEANKKVLKQLDKKNIPYYRSSVDGTITITGNGSGIYEVTKEE